MITWILATLGLFMLLILTMMHDFPSLRTIRMARKIHGLSGLPFIGNVFIFLGLALDDILDYAIQVTKMFPRLSRFEIGGVISIIVQEPEDIQTVIGGVHHTQKGQEYLPIIPWLRDGLLLSFGNKWHSRRKLLTPTFHFRILGDSLIFINHNSCLLAESLLKTGARSVKVENYVTKCTLDVIGESAMGIKLGAQTGQGNDYMNSVKRTSTIVVERILSVWQHKDWIFYLSPSGKSFTTNLKTLHDFTKKIVGERKQEGRMKEEKIIHEDNNDGEAKVKRAFLDALLEMQKSHPESLADEDIYEEVDTFMFEGHDTVSTAITFALYLLGHHQDAQDETYKELEDIFSDSDREVTMADTHMMVYLEKVIKETLRLYPSVPYMSRTLSQDCVLDGGVVLPKRINAVILPYLVHRNERFFPDPEKFDPERFSEDECQKRHPYAYLPFSAGPRNCIGQKFAMLEMKVTLANILRKVRVEAITRRDEFKILPSLIIAPSKPLFCKFYPRKELVYY